MSATQHGSRFHSASDRDRQSFSQRDQSAELHFPKPRIRTDGDRVLLRADEAAEWYRYWRDRRFQWYVDLGLSTDKLHLREHDENELAHYAAGCADVEYDFPFGISELKASQTARISISANTRTAAARTYDTLTIKSRTKIGGDTCLMSSSRLLAPTAERSPSFATRTAKMRSAENRGQY